VIAAPIPLVPPVTIATFPENGRAAGPTTAIAGPS
jgi:hypothetical protein